MNASVITLTTSPLHFDWGTDGLVVWIEELDGADSLTSQMDEVLERIGFAIELQTGWDHRTDTATLHPLYGYKLLLRNATGLWNAILTDDAGRFVNVLPLQELDYEMAYEKVMWVD
ncbi:MAG: hypothetical protein H7319_12225 [Spirosoma sp.]|nr:hypothetical protein [Spirosoma sp.]